MGGQHMGDRHMTYAEIEATYPNQWVFVEVTPGDMRLVEETGGRVRVACDDRDEFDRRLPQFRGVTRGAILYIGEPDPDEVFVLNLSE